MNKYFVISIGLFVWIYSKIDGYMFIPAILLTLAYFPLYFNKKIVVLKQNLIDTLMMYVLGTLYLGTAIIYFADPELAKTLSEVFASFFLLGLVISLGLVFYQKNKELKLQKVRLLKNVYMLLGGEVIFLMIIR